MTEKYLGPIVSGDELRSELRRRKQQDIFNTVSASSKRLVADKVKLEEADGWKTVKKNLKSTRLSKPKPADEQFEDQIWSILAQMGFKEMSKGRQFTIAVETGLPPRQIDVFAKDDETAIIVECTRRDNPGRKSMVPLIDRIKANREKFSKAIRKSYGHQNKLKVKYVIATRNISWSDADLEKCREAQIAVIADGEIDYYSALVKHLKQAARYQFLSHMFSGQKIEGLAREVFATRGKMGGEVFYSFLMRPDELLKIAYVGHKASRDTENLETYQRMLQTARLKKIARYINDGGRFPTNIVVNLKTARKSGLRFDVKEKFGQEALGLLHLPANYASAWIIDGQHRLYGYSVARDMDGFKQDATVLPVLAYENLSANREMDIFIDINSKQVKVATSLLVELYSDLHWKSSDPEEAFQALLSRIASRLNSQGTSPLHDRMVVVGKKKTHFRCLTQTSIRDGLMVSKLLGSASGGNIVPGPFSTEHTGDYEANLRKGLAVISDCLQMFASELENHWDLGDSPGGYLCTNNGIRALFHVMKDIADHVYQQDTGVELYSFGAEKTIDVMTPYLYALVEYYRKDSDQEFRTLRAGGSSLAAVRRQAFGMEAAIQESFPKFKPAGLQRYLASRDEVGTNEARKIVFDIQSRIFIYVINRLKDQYGTENKQWWTKGIPVKIRTECTRRWEEKDRDGKEEGQLFLQNYIEICIHNWDLVKNVISLDAADKEAKKVNTKWIKHLNDIRNRVAHPEQGVLDVDQVKLVREIYAKVKKYFPEGEV